MASLSDSKVQIAGIGHVYYGNADTEAPDLWGYTFGDGTTLEGVGWTWLGDTSSENLIEFSTDGGDTNTKRTWDRQGMRSTREDVTNKVTINAVNLGEDTMQVAFPGSVYDAEKAAWDIVLDASAERAILVVIQDGQEISAYLFRRVSLAGQLPSVSLDNFTEVKIEGTLLAPNSGKTRVQLLEPRVATGVGSAKPAITSMAPNSGKVGARVVIKGTNFDGVRKVTFKSNKKATFEKRSATEMVVYVPKGAETGEVNITNNKGTSDNGGAASFTVQA